ncbi:MAG: RNA methyltransferase [Thermoguttaceae bacterium]|nr:RNA methyltransferase [Thermoguttaceae bacterium]
MSSGFFSDEIIFDKRVTVIDALDDPRLDPYRNLRERTLRGESIFIAEGPLVVERLLRSRFEVKSVLTTRKESGFGECFSLIPEDLPIYYVDERSTANQLLGYEFHQGILALGQRSVLPTLTEGMSAFFRREDSADARRSWIVLPDATKPDNLGLVFRCAAALGAEAVVLGECCCDPFSRRALRVSMGGVLQTPIYQARDLLSEIKEVQALWKVPFYATVLDDEAMSLYEYGKKVGENKHAAFVFGNEYTGLTHEQIAACDGKITIPMNPDVDSLNLGVSVGIFLYEFNRFD